ncbi:MAG: DUF1501 domain-containing protein [Planctomycetota bacterium]
MGRRTFLTALARGGVACALPGVAARSLLARDLRSGDEAPSKGPHFAPRAKRIVSLFMSGGPSQLESFDFKPELIRRRGEELPDSVRQGQRLTGMSGNQSTLPMVGSPFPFARHGQSGADVSSLFPHTARIVDKLCIVRSLHTEQINHDPAITFFQTGFQVAGRPSVGAWLSYGLGNDSDELPTYCVLVTQGAGGQPIYARLWGAGFLPAEHQGTQLRAGKDAVLYLADPPGIDREARRAWMRAVRALQEEALAHDDDPAIAARLRQYELAFRMQTAVPEVTDLSAEPESTFALYGDDARKPGTFAANCLLARRLLERGVRMVQLFHRGWDHHDHLPAGMPRLAGQTDRAGAALVEDLARRGLLDDTLVVWGGEFGRTCYSQGRLTADDFGRDHHPRCFSMWLAGGGVRAGTVYGETDDLGYNIVRDPVHVHDLQATLLHLLGLDHERLTYRYQGRRFRLTDVGGRVVPGLLA